MTERGDLAAALGHILSPRQVLSDPADIACYAYDASYISLLTLALPEVVVFPESAPEVVRVVRFANEHHLPLTARASGSGMSGGCVPARGGIVLSFTRMNRILEVDADNLQVWAEPGVIHAQLNARLKEANLFFPPDPGSSSVATLGGMIAYNARGMRAVKYGDTARYVLGLQAVMPDGEIIETGAAGSRALVSSSGYDLTRLLAGSEGTLALLTGLRLRLLPLPRSRGLVTASFDDLERAGRCVQEVLHRGILPSAIEILDHSALLAANIYKPDLHLPEADAMLIFEVDGGPAAVAEEAREVASVAEALGAPIEFTSDPVRMAEIWEGRRVLGAAASLVKPGGTRVAAGEDIVVPIARVPEALRRIRELSALYRVPAVTYGHVGVGSIHAALVIDLRDDDERRRVLDLADAINLLALELKGSVTGEHGIGLARAAYMRREHGTALDLMVRIKRALDPLNLLNPGKMALEEAAGTG